MTQETREAIAKVSKEPCRCVSCSMCNGTGRVRYGDYMGESDPCEDCDNGITEVCERCQLMEELEHE